MQKEKRGYQLSVEQVFETLESGSAGLSSSESKARLEIYGYNELKFKKRSSLIRFLMQFHSALIYILLAAAFVTAILDMWMDTWVILAVVLANTIIGFIQEGKAESSVEALEKMMTPECTVLRDGEKNIIPARELVPGDVVLLEGGDKVPADLRLFYAKNMSADEAALTGESVPVKKIVGPISKPDLSPADQRCMAFSGTFITRGSGQGIVVGTGEHAEIGRLAELMKATRKITTPLMRKMADFTRFLVIAILAIAALNFILAVLFGFPLEYSFLASVSLAVAAIPEGLPAILTITLAFGVTAMASRNALIKRLPAAETLGCTTVICTDKTGTLTKNQMTVSRIYCGGKEYEVSGVGYEPFGEFIFDNRAITPEKEGEELIETLKAGYLCNNASLTENKDEGRYSIVGDPTEGALVVSASKAGITEHLPRLDEIPFVAEQQCMATLHKGVNENVVYVKGSPERVLRRCQNQLVNGSIEPLRREEILAEADEMAGGALRVLGMAYKLVPNGERALNSDDLKGLTFLGLQGMIDPPREEVIEAVQKCKRAGIRVVMITGDHAQTAKAIAHRLGIGEGEDTVLTGEELSRMSDDELYEVVDTVSVYARAAPEHKFRIIKQLRRRGHIIAATGDGVNDAPALKAADIGIAMGITGTEVSKEAADMILTDDNFASIVSAVEEGRHVFDNIKKVILYTLPTNGGQTMLVLGAILLAPFIFLFNPHRGGCLPIEPVQILYINLLDAVALALTLIKEPKEKGLLDRPPRNPKERITDSPFFKKVGLVSLVMAVAGFMMFYYFGEPAISGSVADPELLLAQARTAAFTTVMLVHICYIFTARSITESAFTFSPFSNKWVLIGAAITIGLQLTIIYAPPFIGVNPFRTAPLPAEWWIPMILVSLPMFFIIEFEKFLTKRWKREWLK
ncbi:MAG: Potassium-transporting ATPase ATP-binding subunit [Candidatus Methanophagaceae archaeon]|nr:MAG: Potassium-transporting ATPase ATP-binding subunit [Methanophagales archaeon]